jgi:hypothetical protein
MRLIRVTDDKFHSYLVVTRKQRRAVSGVFDERLVDEIGAWRNLRQ